MASNPDSSVFLTPETAKECIEVAGGTPLYAYSLDKLDKFSDDCLAFPNAYGLTVRYAMKACPNAAILKFFNSKGIHIDASSGYEVSPLLYILLRLIGSCTYLTVASMFRHLNRFVEQWMQVFHQTTLV